MSTSTIQVHGKTYRLRSYDELTGHDWRRLTLNIERAASGACAYVDAARSAIAIVAPLAARDSRRWTPAEIITTSSQIQHHLADALGEASEIVDRYAYAASTIAAFIRSEIESEREQHGQ